MGNLEVLNSKLTQILELCEKLSEKKKNKFEREKIYFRKVSVG